MRNHRYLPLLMFVMVVVCLFAAVPLQASAFPDVWVPYKSFDESDSFTTSMISSDYQRTDFISEGSTVNCLPYFYSQGTTYDSVDQPFDLVFAGVKVQYLEDGWISFTGECTQAKNYVFFYGSELRLYDGSGPLSLAVWSDGDVYDSSGESVGGRLAYSFINSGSNEISGVKTGFQVKGSSQIGYNRIRLILVKGCTYNLKLRLAVFKRSAANVTVNDFVPYVGLKEVQETSHFNQWSSFSENDGTYYGFINGFGNLNAQIENVFGYRYRVNMRVALGTALPTGYTSPGFYVLGVVPSSEFVSIQNLNVSYSSGRLPDYPSDFAENVWYADVSFEYDMYSTNAPELVGFEVQTIFKNTYSSVQFLLADVTVEVSNRQGDIISVGVQNIFDALNKPYIPDQTVSDNLNNQTNVNDQLLQNGNNHLQNATDVFDAEQQYLDSLLAYRDTAALDNVSSTIRAFTLEYLDGLLWWRDAYTELFNFAPAVGLVSISVFVGCFFLVFKLLGSGVGITRNSVHQSRADARAANRQATRESTQAQRANNSSNISRVHGSDWR